MFSPKLARYIQDINFWAMMTVSAVLLGGLAVIMEHSRGLWSRGERSVRRTVIWGIGSAAILYSIFTVGDLVTEQLLATQNVLVQDVYALKENTPNWIIAVLLLFFIGPGEELFWRGFVQKRLTEVLGDKVKVWGYLITVAIYTAVHFPSMNPILVFAALVCGLFWGYLYRATNSIWICLISHALWDVMIFIVIPMRELG